MGIIETLSAGFDTVRRKPWLVLVPALLDLGFWIAPKLSILSLVQGSLRELLAAAATNPELAPNLQEVGQALEQMAQSVNLLTLLSSSFLGVPSLSIADTTSFFGRAHLVLEVPGGATLIALVLGLSLLGVLIGAIYLGLIAQQVRDGRTDWARLLRRLPQYWLRLLGAGLLILVVLTCLGLPITLLLGVFGVLSPSLASFMTVLVSAAVLWLLFYLAFVPEAILFGEDSILRAIWHSLSVVRSNFWSALGLFVLVNVITAGLMFIWDWLTASSAGALLAIVANAYIGTGLAAALFIFYRERYRAWQAASGQLRSRV